MNGRADRFHLDSLFSSVPQGHGEVDPGFDLGKSGQHDQNPVGVTVPLSWIRRRSCRVGLRFVASCPTLKPGAKRLRPSCKEQCTIILASLLFVFLALTLTGCPERKTNPIRISDEEVYQKKCGKCHDPFPADHFAFERWDAYIRTHPEKKRHRPNGEEMMSIRYFLGI